MFQGATCCPRCPVDQSSVKNLLKLYYLPVGGRSRVLVSVFHTPAAKYIFNRSLVGACHTSPAAVRALYAKGRLELL